MSVLAIALPPRDKPLAESGEATAAVRVPAEFTFVYSADGTSVTHVGRAAPAALPKADRTIVVLADTDVSWHRLPLPKAPPARMRAALLGVMEENLLDDDANLHLALAPGAQPGQKGWVAAVHRPWLAAVLKTLEAAGREIEKVVPSSAPVAQATGHFSAVEGASDSEVTLVLSRKDGVACLRLDGTLPRAVLQAGPDNVRWTATPAAAAAAERWLGTPVNMLTDVERTLVACRGASNLRQFDLGSPHRGLRALRGSGRRFLSPEWRPVRLGLIALVLVHLAGLNVYAWQLDRTLAQKRQAMSELLLSAFPGVRTVLDAPLQMQREAERARAAAGRLGDADFETLLGAAAAAWPDGNGPAPSLRFESGRLTFAAPGWGEPQLRQFRQRLQGGGFDADLADGRVTVARTGNLPARAGAAAASGRAATAGKPG